MAVQHRGVHGESVAADGVEEEEEEEEGKEQIPNGTLARLKSESGGISIQDFIMLLLCK